MYKFIVMCINGFQGSSYYSSHAEALNAAEWRTHYTGVPWYVTAVKVGANPNLYYMDVNQTIRQV